MPIGKNSVPSAPSMAGIVGGLRYRCAATLALTFRADGLWTVKNSAEYSAPFRVPHWHHAASSTL
jgi:hypothetical protein